MMKSDKVSTFICNRRKDLKFVLADGLGLFSWTDVKNLRDIFNDRSLSKLQLLFDTCETERAVLNWELWPMMPIPYKKVYCSVLSWLKLVIVRISEEPIESFFYDMELSDSKSTGIFFPMAEEEKGGVETRNLSRLNNELSSLQRSLQRKNIHMEELTERLEVLATIDALTNLFNRRAILSRAELELDRAKRTKLYFGLAIVDVNGLLQINEKHGTDIGDRGLVELARMLNISTRSYDGAGRIGGDEFLVYFALPSESEFGPILDRIHQKVSSIKIQVPDADPITIKASIGAVGFSAEKYPHIKIAELLVQAFEALYQSKEMGKTIVKLNAFES